MQNSVELLPFDAVKGKDTKKMTRDKDLFQLKQLDGENYHLSPFTMITFKGYLNAYLSDNGITLCYVVAENETLLREMFASQIKTYDVLQDGNLRLQDVKTNSQKSKKEI